MSMKLPLENRETPVRPSGDSRGRDETRIRILVAARDTFASTGFDRTTIKMIAGRCGLTDAAIYYYFPSKRHLLEALWTIRPDRGIRGIPADKPLTRERLRLINDAALDFLADNHMLMRLMFREALSGDETAAALRNESRAMWRRALRDHLSTIADAPTTQQLSDTIMAYLTGRTMRLHMETGDEFSVAVRSEAFRAEVQEACLMLIELPAGA
jgi:AcrR family transcriptional regulator